MPVSRTSVSKWLYAGSLFTCGVMMYINSKWSKLPPWQPRRPDPSQSRRTRRRSAGPGAACLLPHRRRLGPEHRAATRAAWQSAASTYFKWKKQGDGALPRDVLERISYVLGIYKALQILLPDPRRADGWVTNPTRRRSSAAESALDAHARRQRQRPVCRAPVPRRAARLMRRHPLHRVAGAGALVPSRFPVVGPVGSHRQSRGLRRTGHT